MKNETVLITGTSTGLGFSLAQQLADAGYRVLATMRNTGGKNAAAAKALRDYSPSISTYDIDVADQASIDAAMAEIDKAGTQIDVLINNAGIVHSGLIEGFSIDELRWEMEVNYFGVARMFKAVLPQMRARGAGLIVTVSSLTGRLVFPGFPTYSASKFAIEALAEAYRYELGPLGIESVIVEPGPIFTEFLNNSTSNMDPAVLEGYGEMAQMPVEVEAAFKNFMIENAETGANPQQVVDDIIALIGMPFGERPIRTVSGVDYGVRRYNEAVAGLQAELLEAMQLSQLDPGHKPRD